LFKGCVPTKAILTGYVFLLNMDFLHMDKDHLQTKPR